jgi:general secretion pathway protein D
MKLKKKRLAILTLLILCGFALARRACADSLSVTTPSTVSLGQTFSVTVDITSATNLYAYQFDLGYNPAILSLSTISEGSFLSGAGSTFFVGGSIDNTAGLASATADSLLTAISGAAGSGTLVTFDFNAIGTGSSALSLSSLILLDSNLANINGTTQDGSVKVGKEGVPEPSSIVLLLIGVGFLALTLRRAFNG